MCDETSGGDRKFGAHGTAGWQNVGVVKLTRKLYTSAEVAELLGVGVSSVKRWSDEGSLGSVRTLGGHRRYTEGAIREFAGARGIDVALREEEPRAELYDEVVARETLLHALVRGDAAAADEVIAANVSRSGDLALFLDRVVAGAMKLVGDRWADQTLGVECEHRASHLLCEIIDGRRRRTRRGIRRATLASPPDERHDLPLRLVRLVLEAEGWTTDFLGADVPWESTVAAVRERKSELVLMSSPRAQPFTSPDFVEFATAVAKRGARVAIGGAWARGGVERAGEAILRFRSISGFQRWLRSENEGRRARR